MIRSLRRQSRLRGCNLHPARWQTRLSRVLMISTLAPHVRLSGGLQMIASSRRRTQRDPAFIPDEGDDSNHLPISLLRSNGEHKRRGEAVSELMPWLSADAGKSTQMVTVPIFPFFRAATRCNPCPRTVLLPISPTAQSIFSKGKNEI